MNRAVLLFLALTSVNFGIFCLGADIHLSFSNFSSSKRDHVDMKTVLPPKTVVKVIITDMPVAIGFITVQAHSFLYDVILSFDPVLLSENHANGTNIGLFYRNHGPAVLYLRNPHDVNVTAMVAAVPYTDQSPIPGGCNMEAPLPIKPFLNLDLSPAMVTVDAAPASNLNGFDNCDVNLLDYIMFYKYLPERDFSMESYFDAIRSMLTYPSILNSSYVALAPIEGPPLRRAFNRYSGTGTVYSMIVLNKFENVAVYIPSFTYGCDDLFGPTPCELMSSPLLKIQFALFMCVSAFICFAGHRYFLGELFFMGAIAGGLVSHIVLLMQTSYSGDILLMSSGIGIVSGAIWMVIWWFINSPILSIGLPFLVNGFLTSATVFFYFLNGYSILQSDINYWLCFLVFVFVTFLLSTTNPVKFNMLACSFVGSYGILWPLDYYIGSNLKYIVINVIRRAVVDGFDIASTKPPFQLADGIFGIMWIIFILLGYMSQKKLSMNRPPFPPIGFLFREPAAESVPILTNARFPTYT